MSLGLGIVWDSFCGQENIPGMSVALQRGSDVLTPFPLLLTLEGWEKPLMSDFHPFFFFVIFFFLIVAVGKNSVFQPGYKNLPFFSRLPEGWVVSFLLQWLKMSKGMSHTDPWWCCPPQAGGNSQISLISVLSSTFFPISASLSAGIQLWEQQQHPFLKPLRQHFKICFKICF